VRWFWIGVIGFFLLVIDVGVFSHIRAVAAGPDPVLLFAIFLAFWGPVEDAPVSAWLLGMGKDALSAGTMGLFAVLYMALCFFLSRVRADIFTEYNKSHMVNGGLATLFCYIAAACWHAIQGAPLGPALKAALMVAAWNALLAAPAFWLFFKFSRLLGTARRPR